MAKEIFTKLAGVTKRNEDGRKRQDIIEELYPGMELELWHDRYNDVDENAVEVSSDEGEVIGFLKRDLAARIAPLLDNRQRITCVIADITGDPDIGKSYGVNVKLTIYTPEETEAYQAAYAEYVASRKKEIELETPELPTEPEPIPVKISQPEPEFVKEPESEPAQQPAPIKEPQPMPAQPPQQPTWQNYQQPPPQTYRPPAGQPWHPAPAQYQTPPENQDFLWRLKNLRNLPPKEKTKTILLLILVSVVGIIVLSALLNALAN